MITNGRFPFSDFQRDVHHFSILSSFWGEHRAILFRILELNKLK